MSQHNTLHHLQKKIEKDEKITFVTCYDYTSAAIVNASNIDCILVGDSAAMTMHGHETTIPATMDMMTWHTQAVAKGAPDKFIVADLPFLSYRKSTRRSMDAVQTLMQAGAHAIKLEGFDGNRGLIQHIAASGVPIMGHIGLTPQSVHALSGFRIQGRQDADAKDLIKEATLLEEAGCFAIVVECIPAKVAARITQAVRIPIIGIGAGPYTNGQILVWQDLLGMQKTLQTKFIKSYFNGFDTIRNALNEYHQEVQKDLYPDLEKHSYQ